MPRIMYLILFSLFLLMTYRLLSNVVSSEPDGYTVDYYRSQVEARMDLVHKAKSEEGFGLLYNLLVPEVFCKDLVRIGYVGDGGKWICNPTSVMRMNKCTIYSLGTNNNPSFEVDLQRFLKNKCVVRSIDKDMQSDTTLESIKKANGVFMQALISSKTDENNSEYKFIDVLRKFDDDRIDILKIDIEGAEYSIKNEVFSVPICQVLIEVHSNYNASLALKLLREFSINGYYLHSYEINGYHHHLSEYSFIHEDCLGDYNVHTVYGRYLS